MTLRLRASAILLPVIVGVMSSGCAATMAGKGTDLRGARNRSDVEARIGAPANTDTWDNGWVAATYKVNVPDKERVDLHAFMSGFTLGLWDIVGVPVEMMREKPEATFLYTRNGNVLAWKSPVGSGPDWQDVRITPVVRDIERGSCPLVSHCVLNYEADVRRITDWLGTGLLASTELKLRMARQIGADVDAGRISSTVAVNRLLLLDVAGETRR